MNRKIFILFWIVLLFFITGCASMFMAGSKPWDQGVPKISEGKYIIPECKMLQSGEMVSGPKKLVYYIVKNKGKLVLLELDNKGGGAEISNHWVDDSGNDNFVTYVRKSHGWHYIIPKDRQKPGKRLVFPKGTYTTTKDDKKVTKIIGNPVAECEMIPQK